MSSDKGIQTDVEKGEKILSFKGAWQRFRGPVKDAIVLFAIATIISIAFLVIADLVCKDDSFCDSLMRRISEAFTFIAAASLTGAVYVILSDYKKKAKSSRDEIVVNGDVYEVQEFYVKQ